ncbi:MAG: hypothetical protein ACRDST_23750 [Pseudonocardiaceae bacterium]
MPCTKLLIADDVGLGKTIEAGLVMQEPMLRHRARTMLIVCPAGLTLQWRDETRDKFGLDFRIVDTQLLHQLRRRRGLYVNPWTHYPRLIVSVDWFKRERPMRRAGSALRAPAVPFRHGYLEVVSPRCWSCWTTSASLAVFHQPKTSWPGSGCAAEEVAATEMGRHTPIPPAQPRLPGGQLLRAGAPDVLLPQGVCPD